MEDQNKNNDAKNKSFTKPRNNSYFDTSPISKGLILLGVILLFVYCLYFVVSTNTPQESIHEDQMRGPGSIDFVVPISILFIIVGGIFLFFSRQFVKLSDFAQEVESGEFEKQILEELDTN